MQFNATVKHMLTQGRQNTLYCKHTWRNIHIKPKYAIIIDYTETTVSWSSSCSVFIFSEHSSTLLYLHKGTDPAVVGSKRRIVKSPVIQVIVSGVEVPVWVQLLLHIFLLKLWRCQTNSLLDFSPVDLKFHFSSGSFWYHTSVKKVVNADIWSLWLLYYYILEEY